ncbi:MAG: lipoyl(octanoyl) transferase LipB [Opitutaceae bacterium]|nr:lipoyl(octanoyl) transferase LipB [Opitutaceae bacterium]
MPPNTSSLAVVDWGRTAYRDACDRQAALVEHHLTGAIGDTLVFTEHEPVFTLGLRRGAESHLVWNAERLAREGVAVENTNRGGDITYHGPGQIVGYPIVSLAAQRDLHAYLRLLEEVVIAALATFGLVAKRRDGLTGIWVERRKIAAIGVAVRRWVAYHGFALNVDPDLAHFGGIVPCGIGPADGTVTSLRAELGREIAPAEVKRALEEAFRAQWAVFSRAESPRDLRADPR